MVAMLGATQVEGRNINDLVKEGKIKEDTLSNIVSKQNRDLYNRTKDNELRKAVGDIRSSKLGSQSIDAVKTLVTNVDNYNVDMVEVIRTESEDDGLGWNTFNVDDDDINEVKSDIPFDHSRNCLLYTSPSPRDVEESRMPSSA